MEESNRKRKNLTFLAVFWATLFVVSPFLFTQGWALTQVSPSDPALFMDSWQVFHPGAKLSVLRSVHGQGELAEELEDSQIYRFQVASRRYQLILLVQARDGIVLDFLLRLPSYFLHDTLHQRLIDRMGRQNHYFKKDNAAVYRWNDVKGHQIYYAAACTLVCFPLYLAGITGAPSADLKSYLPLLYRFKISQLP